RHQGEPRPQHIARGQEEDHGPERRQAVRALRSDGGRLAGGGTSMIVTAESASLQGAVLTALREVSDPELDESLVDLGFVDGVRSEGDSVEVALRLPTFWCAPNFAYLMAHDARQAALGVPGVREVRVVLKDHMYADEITSGVSCGESFGGVFGEQADGDNIG